MSQTILGKNQYVLLDFFCILPTVLCICVNIKPFVWPESWIHLGSGLTQYYICLSGRDIHVFIMPSSGIPDIPHFDHCAIYLQDIPCMYFLCANVDRNAKGYYHYYSYQRFIPPRKLFHALCSIDMIYMSLWPGSLEQWEILHSVQCIRSVDRLLMISLIRFFFLFSDNSATYLRIEI